MVSGPLLTSVIVKCFLVKLLTTFSSPTASGAAAPATTAYAPAGNGATAATPPSAPTGISRSMSLPSPMWILSVPPAAGPATGAATGAGAAGAYSSASSAAGAVGAFAP